MKKSLGPRTLAFPTPVWVVGTYDANGKPNAMTAAWASTCCLAPPCVGVAVRKNRLTFQNLEARQAFSRNVPNAGESSGCPPRCLLSVKHGMPPGTPAGFGEPHLTIGS